MTRKSTTYAFKPYGLKALITSDEYNGLSEALQAEYEKTGEDEFALKLDDKGFKSRLDEFRSNNVRLKQETEEMSKQMSKFKDVDPVKYREAIERLQEIEDKELVDKGNLEELFEKRIERMKEAHDGKVSALEKAHEAAIGRADRAESRLKTLVINSAITDAVTDVAAVRKGAMADVMSRAHAWWQLDDHGNPVAYRPGTTEPVFGEDGKAPLTTQEWVKSLTQDAPHLFEGSSGGGASGDGARAGGRVTDPLVIDRNDKTAIGKNIPDIASGAKQVA